MYLVQILSSETNTGNEQGIDFVKTEYTPYVIALIVQGKYETYYQLQKYTFDDYISLAEIILVSEINQAKLNNSRRKT